MNKQDLVAEVAKKSGLTKASAEKCMNSFMEVVTKQLAKGDKISLVGFGTFSVTKTAARTGKNPRTQETIKIPAGKRPKFSAGKALKDAVNKKK